MRTTPKKSRKWMGKAFLGVFSVVILVVLLTAFVFQIIGVDGISMQNTLHDRERLLVTKFDYWNRDPQRFDIVLCRRPGMGPGNLFKRVVGVPGDRIAVYGGMLYVNGERVDEPYIDYPASYQVEETIIPEGHFYVLGDNRFNSRDSHLEEVGPIARDQILGRVRAVVWPLSQARWIAGVD